MYEFLLSSMEKSCLAVYIEPVAVFFIWMESLTSYWICSLSVTTRPCFEAEISALAQGSGLRLFFFSLLLDSLTASDLDLS
jgi:hypothetical protein